jgi:hypothetical protein
MLLLLGLCTKLTGVMHQTMAAPPSFGAAGFSELIACENKRTHMLRWLYPAPLLSAPACSDNWL